MPPTYCAECDTPLTELRPPCCPTCEFPLKSESSLYSKELRMDGAGDYYIDCPACHAALRVEPTWVDGLETFRIDRSPTSDPDDLGDDYAYLVIKAKFIEKDRVRLTPGVVPGAEDRNRLAWVLQVFEFGNQEPHYEVGLSDVTADGVKLQVKESQIEWVSEPSRAASPIDWSQHRPKNGVVVASDLTA